MSTSDRFASVSELPGVAVGRFMIEADLQRELQAVDPYANVTLTPFTGTAERVLAMEVPMKDDAATLLMHACSINRSDLVRMLLIEGKSIEATNSKNKTALMIAAEYGSWACVKALLTAGANTAAHSDDGRTALHYACGGNNVGFKSKVVNELLEAGADMHVVLQQHGVARKLPRPPSHGQPSSHPQERQPERGRLLSMHPVAPLDCRQRGAICRQHIGR